LTKAMGGAPPLMDDADKHAALVTESAQIERVWLVLPLFWAVFAGCRRADERHFTTGRTRRSFGNISVR